MRTSPPRRGRRASTSALELLARLAAEGKVRAVIDQTCPMVDIAAAHAYVERGRSKGKVVVDIA
ncbi:zinc-binding dehydrogenase [Streptomyces sp. NBC_01264]|uniref:zinc-binding dehydrogenase n=1 Tax=Streptomyces sp. NBC_01264 TaxID=2903804 RepID=UPI002258D98D|nr:zinc-binding dehydrogenase [Streptomyces sp. NBC_01264]MCX4782472.1 zinc-binding dehydrogenase [Streptomyces sp. NBC_01264]